MRACARPRRLESAPSSDEAHGREARKPVAQTCCAHGSRTIVSNAAHASNCYVHFRSRQDKSRHKQQPCNHLQPAHGS
jgi:hypothetical protein